MHAATGNRIQINRQGRHQRFPFAGAHFSDLAVMQHHPAYHLHIVVTHPQRARTGLSHHGKRLRQQRIQRFALGIPLPENLGFFAQLLIAVFRDVGFQAVNLFDCNAILLEQAIVTTTENTF